MIIKLEDADITTAQDDSEDRGVIHIPDDTWNHVIKEVEHQDQEWVNSLYIDVGTISIGGSGLPVVIDTVVHYPAVDAVNTWDFTLVEQQTTLTVANQTLVQVMEYTDYYIVRIYTVYGTSKNILLNVSSSYINRYFLFNNATNDSSVRFVKGNDQILYFDDVSKGDTIGTSVYVNKSYFEFLWINN